MTGTRKILMTCKVGPKKHISREAKKGASCNVKEAQSLFSTYRTNTSPRLWNSISRLYQTSLHEAWTILHCYRSVNMQKQSKSLILTLRQCCRDACTYEQTHNHTHTHRRIFHILIFQKGGGGILCVFWRLHVNVEKLQDYNTRT